MSSKGSPRRCAPHPGTPTPHRRSTPVASPTKPLIKKTFSSTVPDARTAPLPQTFSNPVSPFGHHIFLFETRLCAYGAYGSRWARLCFAYAAPETCHDTSLWRAAIGDPARYAAPRPPNDKKKPAIAGFTHGLRRTQSFRLLNHEIIEVQLITSRLRIAIRNELDIKIWHISFQVRGNIYKLLIIC